MKIDNLLEVRNLKVIYPTDEGIVRAVEGIDLDVLPGECAAIVGESGCGKSVTSLAVMRLLNSPPALVDAQSITFDGMDLLNMPEKNLQNIWGSKMSIIFQDALTALNPVTTIGRQVDEVFLRHVGTSKKEAKARTIDALAAVGLPSPERRYHDYPHRLSGGMRQRVLIAMAFICKPKLIIADEPTTALDVTIQAQVLDLLKTLQQVHNTALILITHDVSVVARTANKVYVMYAGKIVEKASVRQLFQSPRHPYSKGLLALIPSLSDTLGERLAQIPLSVPSPMNKPTGCYFHPRCSEATDICRQKMPPLVDIGDDRQVRCHNNSVGEGIS
jgi:oligopeptide/dipeptide ABC transporter ATP-binding protein